MANLSRSLRKSVLSLLLLYNCINLINCLYEDQVGKFDWKQSYVGELKFIEFDGVKRIIIGTEENVVASLQLKNGQIVWRHVLEDDQHLEFLHVDKVAVTVSGDGNLFYVRGWDISYGTIDFEWTLFVEKPHSKWLMHNDKLIHVVPVVNSHLEITTYQYNTGQNNGGTSKISADWTKDLDACTLAGVYWTCVSGDSVDGELTYLDVARPQRLFKKRLGHLIGSTTGVVQIEALQHQTNALTLVRNNARRMVLLGDEDAEALPFAFANEYIAIQNGDDRLLVEYTHDHRLRTIDVENGTDNYVPVDFAVDDATDAVPLGAPVPLHLVAGICRGQSCRYVAKGDDKSIVLVQNTGKIQWTRDESLTDIVAVKFFELPVSEMDASIEHEFTLTGDLFGMLYRRISSQLRQIATYLSPAGHQSIADDPHLISDDFGFHKVIVVATAAAKLYAIDSLSGRTIWSRYLADARPFAEDDATRFVLYDQRHARYHPLSAVCTLIGKQANNGNGYLYTFDPISGKELRTARVDYAIKQTMLMPHEDGDHLKAILLVSHADDLHFYPSRASIGAHANLYGYAIEPRDDDGRLYGYALNVERARAYRTWSLRLGAKVVAFSVKPCGEKVHSQGRVLNDRSVLYKYVNPNLLAVATLAPDPIHKTVLAVYLIDGVTGLIVYSVNHKRAKGPVRMVHSENWLVYTYANDKFRRVELAAVELYEGHTQSNGTAFSSFALSQLPHAETQAYILPVTPRAITATLTERGITNKHVLMALSNGNVAEMPWALLEPRGTSTQLSVNPEEGYYVPYVPELPVPPESYVNYNRTLARIGGIHVSPARLESTSLVLVYGLDLFYTRVAPSKTFDVLKEDFDHWLIVTVLSGLIGASYVTKRLASRKALKQAWK